MRVPTSMVIAVLRGLLATYRSLVETTSESIRHNDFLHIRKEEGEWRMAQLESLEALAQELVDQELVLKSAQSRLAHYEALQNEDPLIVLVGTDDLKLRSDWGAQVMRQKYKEALCSIAETLLKRLKNPQNLMCSYYTEREVNRTPPYEWEAFVKTAESLFGEGQLADALRHIDRVWLELSPEERKHHNLDDRG